MVLNKRRGILEGLQAIQWAVFILTNVVVVPVVVGVGTMFMPSEAFESVPAYFRSIAADGLLVGLIVCLFLEHVAFRDKRESLPFNIGQ